MYTNSRFIIAGCHGHIGFRGDVTIYQYLLVEKSTLLGAVIT